MGVNVLCITQWFSYFCFCFLHRLFWRRINRTSTMAYAYWWARIGCVFAKKLLFHFIFARHRPNRIFMCCGAACKWTVDREATSTVKWHFVSAHSTAPVTEQNVTGHAAVATRTNHNCGIEFISGCVPCVVSHMTNTPNQPTTILRICHRYNLLALSRRIIAYCLLCWPPPLPTTTAVCLCVLFVSLQRALMAYRPIYLFIYTWTAWGSCGPRHTINQQLIELWICCAVSSKQTAVARQSRAITCSSVWLAYSHMWCVCVCVEIGGINILDHDHNGNGMVDAYNYI